MMFVLICFVRECIVIMKFFSCGVLWWLVLVLLVIVVGFLWLVNWRWMVLLVLFWLINLFGCVVCLFCWVLWWRFFLWYLKV